MLDIKAIEAEFKTEWAEMMQPDFYSKTMKAVRFGNMPEDEHSIALQLVKNENGFYIPEQINGIHSEIEINQKEKLWLKSYGSMTIVGDTLPFEPYAMGFLKVSAKDLIKRDLFKQALTKKENIVVMVKNEFRRPGSLETLFQDQIDQGHSLQKLLIQSGFKNREEFIDKAVINALNSEAVAVETYKTEMDEKVDEHYAVLTSEIINQKIEDYYESDPTKEMPQILEKIQEIKRSNYLVKDMKL